MSTDPILAEIEMRAEMAEPAGPVYDRDGTRWERHPAGWSDGVRHALSWTRLMAQGPLSATPPAEVWTCPIPGHNDLELDEDGWNCLVPGCLRSSRDPQGGRPSCECELYDCTGECCGPWQCSCSSPFGPKVVPR